MDSADYTPHWMGICREVWLGDIIISFPGWGRK